MLPGANHRTRGGPLPALLVTVTVLLSTLGGCRYLAVDGPAAGQPASTGTSPPPVVTVTVSGPEESGAPRVTYPIVGSDTWDLAPGTSPVAGGGGTLLTFQVAVEKDISGIDRHDFANQVFTTLSDRRSWTAGGQWRFQRVPEGQKPSFTLYLATPATRDRLCASTYDRYTSCRNGDRVVINVARWTKGVPHLRDQLTLYRQYVINHEVGHRLELGHELCPGDGRPAPVMQQQTLAMHGCQPNAWPYVDNSRYSGPPGEYDDPNPEG